MKFLIAVVLTAVVLTPLAGYIFLVRYVLKVDREFPRLGTKVLAAIFVLSGVLVEATILMMIFRTSPQLIWVWLLS